VDVVGRSIEELEVPRTQLALLDDADLCAAFDRPIIDSLPLGVEVSTFDYANHGPRVVVMHRRWCVGWEPGEHQRRSVGSFGENRCPGGRTVQVMQALFGDESGLPGQVAKTFSDFLESLFVRT
jgi:hypothetical protein